MSYDVYWVKNRAEKIADFEHPTYEGTGKNEIATSMTWECREDKAAQRRKFHEKYILLTSLDESQEMG